MVSDSRSEEPDAGKPVPDLDHPVFDEAFIAGGVKESSLRRLTAPPPVAPPLPATPRRRRREPTALRQPAGPRDWSPDPGPAPRFRGRRRWGWGLLLSLALGVALLVSIIRGGSSRAPVVIGGVQPHFTPAHSPIGAPSNDATGTTTNGPAISGLSTGTRLGTCFNLAGNEVRATTCTTAHRYELVAFEAASGDDAHYPSDAYFNGPVQARCTADLVSYSGQPASRWPGSLEASSFDPRPGGWRTGDRVVYCVAKWVPSVGRSAAHLPPAPPPSVSGTLLAVGRGGSSCLAVRTTSGTVILVLAAKSGYFAVTGTPGQAGIVKGEPPQGTVLKPVGSRVTLDGTVVPITAGTMTCGLTRAIGFTSVR